MPRRWLDLAFFIDEKLKRATVPERLLAAAIIANQDDDGRLRGDPAYLRSIAFLYDDYSLDEVRNMRDHLTEVNPNFIVYQNAGDDYIQLKRHKRYQKPRYYHPSKLPAPPGWPFEEESNQVDTKELLSNDQMVTEQSPSSNHSVTEQQPRERERVRVKNLDLDLDEGKGEGQHVLPSPSPINLSINKTEILDKFIEYFKREWGRVPAENPYKIILREPTAKESAQLRDLAKELCSVGGCPLDYIEQAFKEAAGQEKMHISYVRAILLDWLGIERGPPKWLKKQHQ